MLGRIVKTDQLLEDVQEEATEDLQKMVGARGDERTFAPVGFSIRTRLPWLYVNLMTAFGNQTEGFIKGRNVLYAGQRNL